MNGSTSSRKARHIAANIEHDVRGRDITTGFEAYRFVNNPLPQIDLSDVRTETTFLRKSIAAPLLISCMTGGTSSAWEINKRLAVVAESLGLAIGLGSGRALLEDPELLDTFDVRTVAPNVPLLANLGAVQLNYGYGPDACKRLVETLGADALVLHLNPLQEALQSGGNTKFSGLLAKIADVCAHLDYPVIVKEVGWGIPPEIASQLFDAGVAAVDVAGAGGTSWSEVEGLLADEPWRADVARAFAGWGIPTAQCIRLNRTVADGRTLIASGGITNGIDATKAIALGADVVGIAGPFLRAAHQSENDAMQFALAVVETIRVAMFALGCRTIHELQGTPRLVIA